MITIFITNFFGTSGNKFLAEFRGRKSATDFILVLKILFYGPIITLTLFSFCIYFNWNYISDYLGISTQIAIPTIIYICTRSFYILLRRIFYGSGLVKSYTFNEIISDICMFLSLSFVCITKQTSLLIHCYIISYLIFLILSLKTLYQKIPKVIMNLENRFENNRIKILKNFTKYGLISMIGTVASTGTGYLSLLIIGVYLSHSEAGIYSSAMAIISVLMFIPKLASQVLLPEFSKLFGEQDKTQINILLRYSIKTLIVIASFTTFTVFIFSNQIISLFGSDFETGDMILNIMLPSVFIRIISIPFITFLSGTRFIFYPNIGGIIILITTVISWIFLVPEFKVVGIAFGYTIGIIIGIGFQIYIAISKIKLFMSR